MVRMACRWRADSLRAAAAAIATAAETSVGLVPVIE